MKPTAMKKNLEAELISLAHKILKLKNKSELIVLHTEAKKLHEKLSVLLFLEDHFSDIKPTFTLKEAEEKVIEVYDNHFTAFTEPEVEVEIQPETEQTPIIEPKLTIEEPVVTEEKSEIIFESEPIIEPFVIESDPEPDFISNFSIDEDEPEIFESTESIDVFENAPIKEQPSSFFEPEEIIVPEPEIIESKPVIQIPEPEISKPTNNRQVSLDEILQNIQPTPTFVKAPIIEKIDASTKNERIKKTVVIGLNDKIAFVKYLFGGGDADFIRVVSQLNTLDSYSEAVNFIKNIVKPDYNNWKGKEDLEERFMRIIENKFS